MPTSDEDTLRELNERYVASFLNADVAWYQRHLADDFVCIESNGSLLDKTQFLRQTAEGPGVLSYELEEARIRVVGDVALVHGKGTFRRLDGTTGTSRYTDVYARVDGAWQAVSAQFTHA